MNPMPTAYQQLSFAVKQNDTQQRIIARISERLAATKEAGKIGYENVLLLSDQLNSAASMLADVTSLAEAQKTRSNPPGIKSQPHTLL
jgi:hypothetical protein